MVADSDASSCHNGRVVVRTNEGPGQTGLPAGSGKLHLEPRAILSSSSSVPSRWRLSSGHHFLREKLGNSCNWCGLVQETQRLGI
jgi:hypothetical protein